MEDSLVCKTCKKRVSIGDLKADKSGSGWICLDCYHNQHPEIYKPQKSQQFQQYQKSRLEKAQQPQPVPLKPQKIKYYCSECGYKFYKEETITGKSGKHPSRCPYCNLYSVRQEKDADTILRETIGETSLRFNRSSDNDDDWIK